MPLEPQLVTKTYSPSEVNVVWFGIPFTGFANDTFISLSRANDLVTETDGIDSVGLTVNPNKRGEIEVTLMQNSVTHSLLGEVASLFENASVLERDQYITTMLVTDFSGSVLYKAENAYIKNYPTSELSGNDQTPKTWTFGCERLIPITATNVITGGIF